LAKKAALTASRARRSAGLTGASVTAMPSR